MSGIVSRDLAGLSPDQQCAPLCILCPRFGTSYSPGTGGFRGSSWQLSRMARFRWRRGRHRRSQLWLSEFSRSGAPLVKGWFQLCAKRYGRQRCGDRDESDAQQRLRAAQSQRHHQLRRWRSRPLTSQNSASTVRRESADAAEMVLEANGFRGYRPALSEDIPAGVDVRTVPRGQGFPLGSHVSVLQS